ncbi:MAG: ACP S-malonyltransferase [Oscillospiraceae bacterium]
MNKYAFLFSGQGSQYPGMGQELLSIDPSLEEVFTCASDILGFDLKNACFNFSASELAKTSISQPAIMTISLLGFKLASKLGITPLCVAGHSLGEYAAMIASNVISLEDGYKIIKARAAAMQNCADNQNGAMCAVMGLSTDELTKICNNSNYYVAPVNFNSLSQTVVAGEKPGVDEVIAAVSAIGKRAVPLAVSAAFHSKLMQPAADEFYCAIKNMTFSPARCDFYSNMNARVLTDFLDMPSYLAKHLVSPVMFVDELNNMKNAGCDVFVEMGPGKVLTGLVKKTLCDVTSFNLENAKTYEKLADFVAKEN